MSKFMVGRSDGAGVVWTLDTLEEAEAKIEEAESFCPADVHNGEFYIDEVSE